MVTDIALSVTAAGVIIALFGLRQSYRSRLRQFESMYVQRYWSIMDRLSLDALSNAACTKPDQADERAIRAYLLLCEDELGMRKQGYIADATYEIWAGWMRAQLGQPMFAATWRKVTSESSFPTRTSRPFATPTSAMTRLRRAGSCGGYEGYPALAESEHHLGILARSAPEDLNGSRCQPRGPPPGGDPPRGPVSA
jgi:hypothetical protein